MTATIGVWIGALLTLCIYSFLYKDNPFYEFAEKLFVGVSAGYWMVYMVRNVIMPNLVTPVRQGHYIYIVAGVLGVMMLTRILPRIGWLSRWAIAFSVGMGSGYYFVTFLQSNALDQIRGTLMMPISFRPFSFASLSNIILVVGVLTALIYFFFSKEHKGVFGGAARVGVGFLMVAFGASFGYTVMARISLLIGRMQFLLYDWLGTMGIHLMR